MSISQCVSLVRGNERGKSNQLTDCGLIAIQSGRDHALIFEAMVAGKKVTGCDFLHVDNDGRIDDVMVMVRPLSGATALAEAMGAQFARIRQEALEPSRQLNA